jgi:hypothetical protein
MGAKVSNSSNNNTSSGGSSIVGPTVVPLPYYAATNRRSGRAAAGGTSTKKNTRGGGSGSSSGLMIIGFLLLVCLHTMWQANLQLILEDHAKRALQAEATQVYSLFKERQRVAAAPSSAAAGGGGANTTTTLLRDYFHTAAQKAYSHTEEEEQQQHQPANNKNDTSKNAARVVVERRTFDVHTWNHTIESGGLVTEDRQMIGRIYGQAHSVFEFGLGESTYIANHVGVPRFAGIDSNAASISAIRDAVDANYRFYLADVGMTGDYGMPRNTKLHKSAYDYQVVPLLGEPKAFDVYMIDGRFRIGCLIMSFLHASSSSAAASASLHDDAPGVTTMSSASPTVLVHDCMRTTYHAADYLLDLVEHSGKNLCAYKRKVDTTDAQLYELWTLHYQNVL